MPESKLSDRFMRFLARFGGSLALLLLILGVLASRALSAIGIGIAQRDATVSSTSA